MGEPTQALREMNLREYIEQLPTCHLARKQFEACLRFLPLTPELAEREYAQAEPIPMSKEEIDGIVEQVMRSKASDDPVWRKAAEQMRERSAKCVFGGDWWGKSLQDMADAIRALPLEEPKG